MQMKPLLHVRATEVTLWSADRARGELMSSITDILFRVGAFSFHDCVQVSTPKTLLPSSIRESVCLCFVWWGGVRSKASDVAEHVPPAFETAFAARG